MTDHCGMHGSAERQWSRPPRNLLFYANINKKTTFRFAVQKLHHVGGRNRFLNLMLSIFPVSNFSLGGSEQAIAAIVTKDLSERPAGIRRCIFLHSVNSVRFFSLSFFLSFSIWAVQPETVRRRRKVIVAECRSNQLQLGLETWQAMIKHLIKKSQQKRKRCLLYTSPSPRD